MPFQFLNPNQIFISGKQTRTTWRRSRQHVRRHAVQGIAAATIARMHQPHVYKRFSRTAKRRLPGLLMQPAHYFGSCCMPCLSQIPPEMMQRAISRKSLRTAASGTNLHGREVAPAPGSQARGKPARASEQCGPFPKVGGGYCAATEKLALWQPCSASAPEAPGPAGTIMRPPRKVRITTRWQYSPTGWARSTLSTPPSR